MNGPDTGLDLLPFLRLLRADYGVWLGLGAILLVFAAVAWSSWGSRRALRKCLVLSIGAHVGLLVYGGGLDGNSGSGIEEEAPVERIQEIRVLNASPADDPAQPLGGGAPGQAIAGWDRPRDLPADDPRLAVARLDRDPDPLVRASPEVIAPPESRPPDLLAPEPATPEAEVTPIAVAELAPAPADPNEIPDATPLPTGELDPSLPRAPRRVGDNAPIRRDPIAMGTPVDAELPSMRAPSVDGPDVASATSPAPDRDLAEPPAARTARAEVAMPDADLRTRPSRSPLPGRSTTGLAPVTIARASGSGSGSIPLPLPAPRALNDVPEAYRDRLDPDRSARARTVGASDQSEQAVERALDWLARHQDADGRWNAGKKRYANDDADVPGETNHTMHCPPGDICAGECFYYEADTATTGLALLAYLGAGYTHRQTDGKYTAVVAKGLQYLLLSQRADGDLRGESRAVGMYCHAMASLALCEAYALTGDERLRKPAQQAVNFLLKARAADGLSWRYSPGAPTGDTSLLGWAILVLKSAQSVDIDVPSSVRTGALSWLNLVAEGPNKGLAAYRPKEGPYGGATDYVPGRNRTPTMTAEAWACRQFLGVGGPGPSSDEAAAFLLQNAPDRDTYNLYYWYYGTLAMFQRGGTDWDRWNTLVRDELIQFQNTSGHQAGSWDPKDSKGRYDARGGRIYCTALAAMTLEVYYRYHRPGDDSKANATPRIAPASDPRIRRTTTPAARKP